MLQSAATLREPHRVSRYLEELAGDYHRFYDSCRVLPQGDESPDDIHRARLALCEATRQVIEKLAPCRGLIIQDGNNIAPGSPVKNTTPPTTASPTKKPRTMTAVRQPTPGSKPSASEVTRGGDRR